MKKLLFVLSLSLLALSPAARAVEQYETVDALWKDFDPRALPLDAKVIKETTQDGIVLRTVQYTVETTDGFTVRMLAYYGFPVGAKHLPTVLHVHGGGQNAISQYVLFWAKKGYAAMSINWGGKPLEGKEENGKTDWGPLNVSQDEKGIPNVYGTTPNARANSWYHWNMGIRRSVTFLEQQPEVDPSRVGVFGISMGGRLMWLFAGTETRVRCVTSIYGAVLMGDRIANIPDSETAPQAAANPLWNKTLDAIAYAPRIKCPFLFLSATNDFYGRMDLVNKALDLVPPTNCWRSFAPHYNHTIGIDHSATLLVWMNYWLKGEGAWRKSPILAAKPDKAGNAISTSVSVDRPQDVQRVDLLYSTDVYPESRFWRTVEVPGKNSSWSTNLPLTIVNKDVFVFANVLYKSGETLSAPVVTIPASDLKTAGLSASDAASLVIDDFHAGYTDWFVPGAAANLLLADRQNFKVVPAPDSRKAIVASEEAGARWVMATQKLGDPKWKAPAGAALQVELNARETNSLVVAVTKDDSRKPLKPRVYTASVNVTGGGSWETVTLPLADFKSADDGTPMGNWDDVNLLVICGRYIIPAKGKPEPLVDVGADWKGTPPAVASVKWVPES
jgi:dienelactone hydrolase